MSSRIKSGRNIEDSGIVVCAVAEEGKKVKTKIRSRVGLNHRPFG